MVSWAAAGLPGLVSLLHVHLSWAFLGLMSTRLHSQPHPSITGLRAPCWLQSVGQVP